MDSNLEKLNIFIVDDDVDFAESLADVLELKGHQCELAHSGEEAITTLQSKDFDAVFMDVQLPGKNGVESFLEIKKTKPHARVIMMTGYSVEQLLNQALANGAWGILRKPHDFDSIMKLLDKVTPTGILIADDDQDFVNSISELFHNAGFSVYRAENGRQAIDMMRKNNIDILILDLRMPILNGLETYLELKREEMAVPTIIVTAYPVEEIFTINKLKSLSVTGILTKPFAPENLLQIVQELADDIKKGAR